jgi:NADH-quinone oxidoreductase subunit G
VSTRPCGSATCRARLLGGDGGDLTAVGEQELRTARELLGAARNDAGDGGIVVVLGRASLAESGATIASAAGILAAGLPGVKFLSALRRANVHGAIDMGLAPGLLPGRVSLEAGRGWFGDLWGALPEAAGEDTAAILTRAARGELSALVLLGADPMGDCPDHSLAEEALRLTPFVLSLATHRDRSNALASVVLPVPADGERAGTTTNLEGRVTSLAAKVVPPGVSRAPWMIARELATRLGADLAIENLDSLTDEIGRVAPAYRGITAERFSSGAWRDGAVVPLQSAGSEDERPLPFDPIATPGIASVDEQGAPLRVGAGVPLGGGDVGAPPTTVAVPRPLEPRPADLVVAPRLDAYSHRLVVRRTLYDGGTLVATSPSLSDLASAPVFGLHPSEMARLGVVDGDRLRVRSSGGDVVAPAYADERVARGVVVVAHNPADQEVVPAALVDAANLATDVRLETV